jgi:hypothetical protein
VVLFATKPELSSYLDELARPEQQQFAKLLGEAHLLINGIYLSIYHGIYHGIYLDIYRGIYEYVCCESV